MDVFDHMHVCNHSDQEGRYAYRVGISETSFHLFVLMPRLPLVPAGDDVGVLASAALQRS